MDESPRPAAVKLSPPTLLLRAETRWVLLRAFGPPGAAAADAGEPARVAAVAERLDLAARIAGRSGRERLTAELGPAAAGELLARHRQAAAREMALDALAREVIAVAAAAGVPVALLKFGALRAGGYLAPGSRLAADLDVLAPEGEGAERVQAALRARGFRETGQPGHEHQLPSLSHPALGLLEVHRHVPGVRPPGADRHATFDDLRSRGALTAAAASAVEPAGVWIPVRAVLAAHAAAHGLVQHVWAPAAHPPMRSVSDLLDLGLGGPDGEALAAEAARWLAGSLPAADVEAVQALCRALAEGRPEALEGDRPEGVVGRHLLAGVLDPAYRDSLALRRLRPGPGEAPAIRRLGHAVARGLFPGRAELDLIYGPSRSPWRRLALRLGRPFDLAWRAARAAASRLASAARSRHGPRRL